MISYILTKTYTSYFFNAISHYEFTNQTNFINAYNHFDIISAAMMTNAAEFIECSSNLFPHLVHIFDLTKDFIHRASGVIDIPSEWADLDVTFVKTKVVALRSPDKERRLIDECMNEYYYLL